MNGFLYSRARAAAANKMAFAACLPSALLFIYLFIYLFPPHRFCCDWAEQQLLTEPLETCETRANPRPDSHIRFFNVFLQLKNKAVNLAQGRVAVGGGVEHGGADV